MEGLSMSSISGLTLERRRHEVTKTAWGQEVGEYISTKIKEGVHPRTPVRVENDKLEVDSALLDMGRVYSFEYLGSQMVLWKLPNGAVDLFEIVEE